MIKSLILGAGREVGKSCVVVTLGGKTIMFDCGMHMGYDDERRFPDFSLIPKAQDYTQAIDCVIITHFHLDHVGALPYFTEVCGYEGPIFMTFPTKALSPLMLEDYRKVMTERRGQQEQFTVLQIHECMKKVTAVDLRQTVSVGTDIQLRAYYAGHVLGAAMFHVKVGDSSVVYTGDYNMTPDRHLGAAQIDRLEPDLIITESTYATTIRESKNTREREFLQAVHACVAAGGKVLIPVFALGRAQELCILLDDYWERMNLKVPIYMGAGLTLQANVYYKLLISWTNQKVKDTCATRNTFDFKHVSPLDRTKIDAPGPCVLFATPGMITGGLSLEVFRRWAPFDQNMVVLPGYCIPGTVGYKLQPGKRVKIDRRTQLDVLCQVHHLTSSAHTDAKGIMDLIRHVKPRHVILVHGEKPKMALLKSKITSELQLPCYDPANGEVIEVPSYLNVKVLATERFLTGSRVLEDARTVSTNSDTENKATNLEHVPSIRDYVCSGIVSMNKQGTIQVVDPAEAFSVLKIPEHRLVFKCYCPVYMKPHEDAAFPEKQASAFRESKNMQASDEPSLKKCRKDLQETPILEHVEGNSSVEDGRRDMQLESACPTDGSWSCASTDQTKNTQTERPQDTDGASQKDHTERCSDAITETKSRSDVRTETKEPQRAPTMAMYPDDTESQKILPSLSSASYILHAVYMFLLQWLGTGILEEQADCIIGRSLCLRICCKDLENCEVEITDNPDALLVCSWTSEDETLANRVLSLISTQFSPVSAPKT